MPSCIRGAIKKIFLTKKVEIVKKNAEDVGEGVRTLAKIFYANMIFFVPYIVLVEGVLF